MELTPDQIIFYEFGYIKLNATILYTWLVMALLVIISWVVTRNLSIETKISKWQLFLEVIIIKIRDQIQDITKQKPDQFLYFLGTLYLYLAVSNFLSIVPVYHPPTSSLSTTTALALCVFVLVPFYGIKNRGITGYLKHYTQPNVAMLPFRIISEISRTIALAIRLFGNVMSGTLLVGIILTIAPLFFPIILQLLELLIGQVQAYIFAVLAAVFIGSAIRARKKTEENIKKDKNEGDKND
jgi:F-type H+-transporting ATPase subunit a